jgi:hypothetical protein
MPLGDLTREAVLKALAECDAIGRPVFLAKYGFDEARSYFIVHDGRRYDSKAIAGAAHSFLAGREALRPSEFSGGYRTVRATLKGLGFKVETPPRNRKWSRDELILALDLYLRHRPGSISEAHVEVRRLSVTLNRLARSDDHRDSERFRNANGVYMKLANFLRLDPEYRGKGLKGGNRIEKDVWAEFATDRQRLADAVARIVDGLSDDDAALNRGRRYWALFANPRVYRIDDAVASLKVDLWMTGGKDLRAGDGVVLWRGRGADGQRGIVAFGDVLSDPEVVADHDNGFWADSSLTAAAPRVRIRYWVPPGLPLWFNLHSGVLSGLSVARARGGTAFALSDDDWKALQTLAGAEAEHRPSPLGATPGTPYENVQRAMRGAPRDPFEVDPDKVDRGNQAHVDTVNALADHLRAMGVTPLSPRVSEPEFDLAWEKESTLFVAEIKSLTEANEEKQLRLGLGQVLRYRHQLAREGRVVAAVLVAEREPRDISWHTTCSAIGVRLAWPGAFEGVSSHVRSGEEAHLGRGAAAVRAD